VKGAASSHVTDVADEAVVFPLCVMRPFRLKPILRNTVAWWEMCCPELCACAGDAGGDLDVSELFNRYADSAGPGKMGRPVAGPITYKAWNVEGFQQI
jgi:hypothetical protein